MCLFLQYSGVIPDILNSIDPTNRTDVLMVIDRGKVCAFYHILLVLPLTMDIKCSARFAFSSPMKALGAVFLLE